MNKAPVYRVEALVKRKFEYHVHECIRKKIFFKATYLFCHYCVWIVGHIQQQPVKNPDRSSGSKKVVFNSLTCRKTAFSRGIVCTQKDILNSCIFNFYCIFKPCHYCPFWRPFQSQARLQDLTLHFRAFWLFCDIHMAMTSFYCALKIREFDGFLSASIQPTIQPVMNSNKFWLVLNLPYFICTPWICFGWLEG